MGSTGGVAAAKMAAVPVKAPRDALTGKAAFQAAGYRRRGSRRSERGATGVESAANRSGRIEAPKAETQESRKVPRVELYVSHAWDRHGSTRGTGQVPSVKRAGRHGKRMPGGLLERQLPFKRVKTAIVSFMLPLGACPALPSGASQASPAESVKYVTLPVSSVHPYGDRRSQTAVNCPYYNVARARNRAPLRGQTPCGPAPSRRG